MGKGTVQQWVTQTSQIKTIPAVITAKDRLQLLLEFEPYEAKLLIIGPEL
jgi:hypothetical protein